MYSTVASACGFSDDAYRLYQRAARLDLDNFNADTEDGLHITSMAGSWIALAHGFAGMDYQRGVLAFTPRCPQHWKQLKMRLVYRGLVIVHQHKTEHHLNSKQKGMKIPIDGRLIQQLDVIAGGDSAERSHGLAVQSPYVFVDGIIVIVVQNGSGQGKSPVLELLGNPAVGFAYSRWKLMFFAIGSSMKVMVKAIIARSPDTLQKDSMPFFTKSSRAKG